LEEALVVAARRIAIPALLVRGGASEVVQEVHAREFLELVPHADYVDVAEARHMVAGDSNVNFSAAIFEFLGRNAGQTPGRTNSQVSSAS
jgi:pimeloyl-ACP methyl ester carboxylesterase